MGRVACRIVVCERSRAGYARVLRHRTRTTSDARAAVAARGRAVRRFRDKQVLEIGCGAGYDAYEIVRNGADYTGIDIAPENPELVKKHLAHYGLDVTALRADAENLPFPDGTFDVAYSNGVLHHTPDIERAFSEAFRVLRPGGEFYVSVYNRNSIVYRVSLGLFEHVLSGGMFKRSLATRLQMIEFTTSDELPVVNVYNRKQLTQMLEARVSPASERRCGSSRPKTCRGDSGSLASGVTSHRRRSTRLPAAGVGTSGPAHAFRGSAADAPASGLSVVAARREARNVLAMSPSRRSVSRGRGMRDP